MPATDSDLCARLLAFPIDEGTPDLTFETRLAHENGWDLDFARRVVNEYKRFVFLAMTAGHTVTPSDHVDQAWHLHLTYTHSYWERMCGELLARPLHHGPTRGGAVESTKYRDLYARTLASYRGAFGEEPPADVWPPVEVRFGVDLSFVRVNTALNWVVPKSTVRRVVRGGFDGTSRGIRDRMQRGDEPLPSHRNGFRPVPHPTPGCGSRLGAGSPAPAPRSRGARPGDDRPELNWADAAYLAGRRHRLTTAAIARLVATGAFRVSNDGKWLEAVPDVPAPSDLSPVEAEVVRWLPLERKRADLAAVAEKVNLAFADRAAELRSHWLPHVTAPRVCLRGRRGTPAGGGDPRRRSAIGQRASGR